MSNVLSLYQMAQIAEESPAPEEAAPATISESVVETAAGRVPTAERLKTTLFTVVLITGFFILGMVALDKIGTLAVEVFEE